jgi:hypothetical protein
MTGPPPASGRSVRLDVRTQGTPAPFPATIELAERTGSAFRPQRLDDVLEQPLTFLAVTDERGAERIIGKDALLWLRVSTGRADLSTADLRASARALRVHLTDETSLAGTVLWDEGPRRESLVDFLNGQGQFFQVLVGGELYFVNQRFVGWIEEVAAAG